MTAAPVLVGTVAAVGVLHTLVPDHWAPIAVLARARGWSRTQTARAAAIAGFGHVASTLVLGVILWLVGASVAARYGHLVNLGAAVALIAFGAWIAIGGWREAHAHSAAATEGDEPDVSDAASPYRSQRTALLLILGSSPMIEGLPLFLAASQSGAAVLGAMAVVFAAATMVTYVVVTSAAARGLERMSLGPLERYGEVLSGGVVVAVGAFALLSGW